MRKTILLCLFLLPAVHFADAQSAGDSSTAKSARFLLFPFFLKSPETGWGLGGVTAYFFNTSKNERTTRTSDISLTSLYTERDQTVTVFGVSVFFPEEKKIARLQSSYSYYPDQSWGIGNHTPDEAKEEYSIKQFYLNPQLLQRVYKDLYAGINYEYQNVHDFQYKANGVFDQQNIPGRHEGHISGLGGLLTWDSRNSAYSPSKGFFGELNASAYGKAVGSDFSFSYFSLDLRKYMAYNKSETGVVAMQLMVKENIGTVPIRQLAMLGGPELLRGFYKGRYTDHDLIVYQAELRQFLFWRLGFTVFGGVGEVFPHLSEFQANGFHYAGGGGLRILVNRKEKLNLRVDYGYGEGTGSVYVILKEAF